MLECVYALEICMNLIARDKWYDWWL